MNSYQKALNQAMEGEGCKLELISKGQNQLRAIYNGRLYNDYFDLPITARYAVAKVTSRFSETYNELRQLYSAGEAELRIAWCLFGSVDSHIDINVVTQEYWHEMSTHCTRCQYSKPFCMQVLPHLTKREQECFLLMRNGLTDKEVARCMGISPLTVVKHMSNAVCRLREILGRQVTRQFVLTELQEAGV